MSASTAETIRAGANRRRRIDPQAGRALEILGHAIEYLADEFVHEGGSFSADNGQLQAVQLLMALNRQVYFECPEVPPFQQAPPLVPASSRGMILLHWTVGLEVQLASNNSSGTTCRRGSPIGRAIYMELGFKRAL
ncbi:MAG TPA: hypothetical protein VFC37_23225 [Terracidiphilus sp.]|nr:hypothetical protein [Terracidiphilus sp.]